MSVRIRLGQTVIGMALSLGLMGCETGTFLDDIGTVYGAEPKSAAEESLAPVVAVPVQSVRTIEIGRTRNGFIITAYGTAPGLGYSVPSLRVRRNGAPGTDGFIDFDFVARAPDEGFQLPPGSTRSRALRADLPVDLRDLQGVAGIRVHALAGGVQMVF